MIRILFVCHGNICRSPMAEFIFRHLAAEAHCTDQFEVASAAVSTEETGNDIYPPAKRILAANGIPFAKRAARQMTLADYRYYDHIICMDQSNIRLMRYITGDDSLSKVSLLMSWAGVDRNVADPWYTGDFQTAFDDIMTGCKAMLTKIRIKPQKES